MNPVVIDASVALKWCLPGKEETFATQAEKLLTDYRNNEANFIVPDLFWLEVGNALWKAVWRGMLFPNQAEKGYSEMEDLAIPTIPSVDLVPQALQLAIADRRSVYDSVYVVLALRTGADLITADERLANALAARFPVKWLGAL